ncbi:MAG: hypothetical protein DRI81_09080 [Chloroflexi bacterium]|nr:MAG: hypothetical protein DRI81_09080 [Chloroflexota bacterium]
MSNWIGQTIGSYQIAEEIGQGGMATVYRAYQHQLERWVAIKIMQATEASGKSFLTRFRREAKAIAALRHPNILTIYDYGEEQGIAYFVIEYVAGGTLKDHLTGQPKAWPDAATLILPVGRALAYAHSQGVVHRDVKPANILLARPDWPLLADFGLIKLVGRKRGITQPGVSIGTPAYFSPEQAAGDDIDHRTDIYGLAIVLYELLTGRLPFEASSPIEMMLRRLREDPIPPSPVQLAHHAPTRGRDHAGAVARAGSASIHHGSAIARSLATARGYRTGRYAIRARDSPAHRHDPPGCTRYRDRASPGRDGHGGNDLSPPQRRGDNWPGRSARRAARRGSGALWRRPGGRLALPRPHVAPVRGVPAG